MAAARRLSSASQAAGSPSGRSQASARAGWRAVLELAATCAREVEAEGGPPVSEVARATLARQVRTLTPRALRPAGAAAQDVAEAFLLVAGAFARPETPAATRRRLAPLMTATAGEVDQALHALATLAFERAHAGRPEVWG